MNSGILQKYKPEILGILLGAIGGFAYYKLVGCATGNCMLASNPFIMVPYGSLLGYFISGLFKKEKK